MPIEPHSSFPDLRLTQTTVCEGRHLPRWEAAGAVYHVTFHLADSVPAEQLLKWREARQEARALVERERRPLTPEEKSHLAELFNERIERYLSAGHGECLLRAEPAAMRVATVLEHDNGVKYALHAWCVMPNHLHVIAGGLAEASSLNRVLAEWKRITAHRINRLSGRTGPVWHEDSYTRIIRDAEEYRNQLSYVWHNPESAGLTGGFLRKRYV